jgi:hypothetical protein
MSIIASSSGVSPPSIILKRPTRLMMLDLKTSSGFSSSLGVGKSKGLIWFGEAKEILKKDPPTALAKY